MPRYWMTAVVLAAGLALTAAPAPSRAAQINVVTGGDGMTSAESEDHALYEAAMDDFQSGGYAALAPHLPKMRAALDRAPAKYGLVEQTAPGRWVVRGGAQDDALARAVMISVAADGGGPVNINVTPNVYGGIALLLGSEAVERRDLAAAATYLDRGLALQPANGLLAAERMAVLQARGRFAEALALGDATVALGAAEGPPGSQPGAGILNRRRGFSLIELGRLDEAQTAYETSLEYDPGNAAAEGELRYIEGLRAGEARTKPIAIGPPVTVTE